MSQSNKELLANTLRLIAMGEMGDADKEFSKYSALKGAEVLRSLSEPVAPVVAEPEPAPEPEVIDPVIVPDAKP
jgi:hypothetical protein